MKLLLASMALVLVSGCSGDTPGSSSSAPSATTSTADVCVEVTAGIAAFNRGEFQQTVDLFRAAVPLAEAADHEQRSTDSGDLLDAVHYYAGLAPGDYLSASLSSPDFAKYKQITLSQCASDTPTPESGTVPA